LSLLGVVESGKFNRKVEEVGRGGRMNALGERAAFIRAGDLNHEVAQSYTKRE
jgi:hypothetical protein